MESEIKNYIIPAFPLHLAYDYLSATHKADYLRMYFMHFYGGGYSDIKVPTCNWESSFETLLVNSELWGIGYPEISESGVANDTVRDKWQELIGNGCYIMKPNTNFTREWYQSVHKLLDEKLLELRKNPAKHPRDCKSDISNYPLEWNEMLGRIFHLLNYKYHTKFDNNLTCPVLNNYL